MIGRRRVLRGLVALCALPAAVGVTSRNLGRAEHVLVASLAALLPPEVARTGAAWIAEHGGRPGQGAMVAELLRTFGTDRPGAAEYRRAVAEDFAVGRIEHVGGWRLARTEVFAAAALAGAAREGSSTPQSGGRDWSRR